MVTYHCYMMVDITVGNPKVFTTVIVVTVGPKYDTVTQQLIMEIGFIA